MNGGSLLTSVTGKVSLEDLAILVDMRSRDRTAARRFVALKSEGDAPQKTSRVAALLIV